MLLACFLGACDAGEPAVDGGQADARAPDAAGSAVDAPRPDAFDPSLCDERPPCPAPDPDRVSVCGRVFDMADSEPMLGPADWKVLLADPPFPFEPDTGIEAVVDACGWYFLVNVAVPTAMAVITVDDLDPTADTYHLTGSVTTVTPGNVYYLHVFATGEATDVAWGAPPGEATFGTAGVYVPIFVDTLGEDDNPTNDADPFHGAPRAGVTAARAPGTAAPTANDYYLADEDPYSRQALDVAGTQTTTGANGTAFLVNESLGPHTGLGPEGCTWEVRDAASIPDVIFVQVVHGECI